MTPHTFAALIVERMFANRPPFNSWQPDPGIVPENAGAVCELYAHAYQLKILLDLIIRKFGEPIAMLVEGSLPRLSQVVSRLEKRGWVRRVTDPDDGRYTLAILTDEGKAKVMQTAPGHVGEVRRLVFDPLTRPQVRQLQQIGRRILRAVDPAEPRYLDRWPNI